MHNYSFRRLTDADLPMMRSWLQASHVRSWWGDPDRNLALMKQDMNNPAINMQVVQITGRPIAYLHHHDVAAFRMPQFADIAHGARAISTFVGDANYLSPGYAAGYISDCVQSLRLKYTLMAAAPNSTDMRKIGIYLQAGFRKRRMAPTRDGRLVQVMTHN